MSRINTRWVVAGVVVGAAAGVGTTLVLRGREQRQALTAGVDAITRRAVDRLVVPAESRFLEVNGPGGFLRLHAVLAGSEDGDLVVLLHGFPDCWYSWAKLIPRLAKAGYRVVALDQRGYNLSAKPEGISQYALDLLTADVREVIRGLGREQAIVVGHDWGGVVAWRLAMDYPEVVSRLAILNAPHPRAMARELKTNPTQQLRSWYTGFFQISRLPEALLTLSPRASARLFYQQLAVCKDAYSDQDLEVLAAAMAQPGAMTAMLNWYRAAVRFPPAKHTQTIEQPTLVLWAEDDPALAKSLTYGLENWVPNMRLRYFPSCGHWVHGEMPGEVNDELLQFLEDGRDGA